MRYTVYIHCVHSLWCTRNKYKLSVAMLRCFKMILYKSTHDYPYIILYLECNHVQYLLQMLCSQTAAHCRDSARLHTLVSTYVHTMCMSQPQLSTHPSHNTMLTYVSATVESHPHHHPPPPTPTPQYNAAVGHSWAVDLQCTVVHTIPPLQALTCHNLADPQPVCTSCSIQNCTNILLLYMLKED